MRNSKKFFFGSLVLVIILTKLSWDKYKMGLFNPYVEEDRLFAVKKMNTTIYIPTIYREDCKVMSIDSLKNFSSFHKFPNGIPKLLHYVTNEEDIPKAYADIYQKCGTLNKDMRVIHWTDASFYRVFVTQFDKTVLDKWKQMFSNLDDDSVRTTMIRFMVLFVFGGVSVSLDTVCQKPIADAVATAKNDCFVSVGDPMRAHIEWGTELEVGESVIGCVSRHGFLHSVIRNDAQLAANRSFLTNSFVHYNRTGNVVVLDRKIADQLLPRPEMDKICATNSTDTRRGAACRVLKTLKAAAPSAAMLVHRPVYGVARAQIIAKDVCSMGFAVHIVIV